MRRGLLLLLFGLISSVHAQTGAVIAVRLAASGADCATLATVSVWPGQATVQAAVPGEAVFDGLAAGLYRVEVTADRCVSLDTSIRIAPGERADVALTLRPVAVTLPEITVETRREGAEQVFQREQIVASAAQTLPDFLRQQAGLDMRSDGAVGAPVTARIGGSAANQVLVHGGRAKVTAGGQRRGGFSGDSTRMGGIGKGAARRPGECRGEAIGGILEITTRAPANRPEFDVSVEAHPSYDRVSMLRSGRTGPIASLLSLTRTQGPGDFHYTITEDDGTGAFTVGLGRQYRRVNADITRDQLLVKLGTPPGMPTTAEVSAALDRASRGMPGYLAPQLTPLARQATQNEALNLRLTHSAGRINTSTHVAWQHDSREFTNPDAAAMVKQSGEVERTGGRERAD